MQKYLQDLHQRLMPVIDGMVADYIPELALADPGWFGISIVTVDGNVYQVGDSRQPFTVQSISKALIYGMALEDNGIEKVFEKVGVEPSGEAFNSISLEAESGRPLNPMINAGAIATTGLIKAATPEERINAILKRFERYTGHPVSIDESVYVSERDTGHRNRAIAHLLRNADILEGVPEDVLDVYFKQCSISVTARDLALMGACLANSGANPITGVVALQRAHVEKVLSVMSTCGMYDYSGNWVFSVGMPAKSGVGGGIMAVLPGQFGLGVFSPSLDPKGNSVRGIRVCEQLSEDFGLHVFKVARATSSSVLRVMYNASEVNSKHLYRDDERALLSEHGSRIQVYELQGELMFGSTDSVLKTVSETNKDTGYVILDFRRIVELDSASIKLLAHFAQCMQKEGKKLFYTGARDKYRFRKSLAKLIGGAEAESLLQFSSLDRALEWCERHLIDQVAPRQIEQAHIPLEAQYLCEGLTEGEMTRLREISHQRRYAPGEVIFQSGHAATSFFLIVEGLVDIVIKSENKRERRLVTLGSGMSFGEFSMVTEGPRSAEARAVNQTLCYELYFQDIAEDLKSKLLVSLAKELASRLTKEARELQIIGGTQ
jgi:glutaminase